MAALTMGSVARVLYDFNAEEAGELTVRAGDAVSIHDASVAHEGWVLVSSAAGARGLVPVEYISVVAPSAAPRAAASAVSSPSGVGAASRSPAGAAAGPSAAGTFRAEPPLATPMAGGGPVGSLSASFAAAASTPSGGALAATSTPASGMAASALNPDYAHLFASHEEWFKAASAKRQEVYRGLQAEAMDLLRALAEAESRSGGLVSRIGELDALISEERGKWAAKQGSTTA